MVLARSFFFCALSPRTHKDAFLCMWLSKLMSPPHTMQEYLIGRCVTETESQLRKRDMVLNFLRVLIQRLTAEVSREHNIKHSDFTCQLVPFGSWGLRAHLAQDDMDLAFLGAKHVRRRDFFHFFPKLLKEQATVMNVEVIDSARVPIIRCTVDSIPVDISFVRLRIQSIPQDIDLSNNGLLTGLDDACMASLDGPRVHQFILQHISESDLPTFRIALQSIKYWAQQRAIYDKQMGYLGGHAWALLLLKTYMANTKSASTTQLSANSNPISLLRTFFQMWSAWPWPTPVILTDFIPNHDGTPLEYRSLALFEGTIMPIVSPCYPVSNVANTVTKSTLKVLMHEFSRAHQILSLLTQPDDTVFNKLFKPLNMIIKYKHFLKIIVSTDTYNTHEAWLGKMPSAIPRFVEFLETVPEIREIRPYIDPFIRISINFRTKYEKTALQNGDNVNGLDYKMLDLDPGTINRTCYLIGLEVISPSPGSNYTLDISNKVASFRRIIDSRRAGSKESDLVVNVVSCKRKDVMQLIEEHQP